MTKTEIVQGISRNTGFQKQTVKEIIESLMETVENSLVKGAPVDLQGFGTFFVKKRAEKKVKNFSGNTLIIPSHSVPAFKPSKIFADRVKYRALIKRPKEKSPDQNDQGIRLTLKI